MSYINKTLMPNEKLLFYTKLHWVIFTSAVIWLIISLLIFIICRNWDFFLTILFDHAIYIWLSLITLFLAIAHAISAYLKYLSAEYAITNKRVLVKSGILHRKSLEIFLNKVEGVHISQNIAGRILGFGSITVNGIGGNKESFYHLTNPLKFRKIIHEQIHKQ